MKEKEAIMSAAEKAGAVIKKNFGKKKKISLKKGGSIVTDIDKIAEQIIKEELEKEFPDYSFLCEESGKDDKKSAYCFVVDPLDGTHAYVLGKKEVSVSIALMKRKEILAGVVYNPLTSEMLLAEKGKGAKLNGKKIKVEKSGKILVNYNFLKQLSALPKMLKLKKKFRDIDYGHGLAYNLCQTAKGDYSAFISFKGKPWDFAAGSLILSEAGGVLKTIKGGKWDVWSGSIISGEKDMVEKVENILN